MLTADLVRVQRRGGELRLRPLSAAARTRAVELAGQYMAIARACVGSTRGELEETCAAVPVAARDRKLADGLRKLVFDRCQFEMEPGCDPAALRREVFARASEVRRGLAPGQRFDRDALLAEIAADKAPSVAEPGSEPVAEIERLLYVDLRSAHRLLAFRAPGAGTGPGAAEAATEEAAALVDAYVTGQAQAVLLRAVRVRARVLCQTPQVYRELFRKLKFLRLLHRIEPLPAGQRSGQGGGTGGDKDGDGYAGGYEIHIDGPYSLFRSVTKYGLQLALLLPSLQACDRWSVQADVQWGKQRTPLAFAIEGTGGPARADVSAGAGPAPVRLPDEVAALAERFATLDGPWQPRPSSEILELPGVGMCVPDLVFEHAETRARVYLEVMGFWSREAVWRRVELVQKGLPHRILFAISSRLRVSEAALDADLPGALYVYKGAMSARTVTERLDRLGA